MDARFGRGVAAAALVLAALSLGAAQAQGVYKSQGAQGPVFSDKPQPGAREVSLPPLNVIDTSSDRASPSSTTPPRPSESGTATPDAAPPAYRSFAIVFPENEGSVVANTAVFEVRVAVDPPLQLGARHAVTVSLNGQPAGRRFTATEFMIPPEFWGDTLPPPNQRMQLDAAIVDGDGRVLRQAAPVSFYLRHASRLNLPPHPQPRPVLPGATLPPPTRQPVSLQPGVALEPKPGMSSTSPSPAAPKAGLLRRDIP